MLNLRYFKLIALMLPITVILAACGGNSGNEAVCGYDEWGDPIFCSVNSTIPPLPTPIASTSTFNIAQGMTNAASSSYSYTIKAQDANYNIYSIQYSSMPGQPATFQSTPASSATITEAFSENNTQSSNDIWTNYYTLSPFQLLGSSANYPGGSEVVNNWQAPPATATVGQQFLLMTSTLYHDSTNSIADGTLTESVGLSANTTTTALLCFTDTVQLTQAGINDNLYEGTTSKCYIIDPAGNLLGMQITTPVNGVGVLQFY